MQTKTSASTGSSLALIPPTTSSVRRAASLSFYQDKGKVRPGGLLVPYPWCFQLVVHGLKAPQPFWPVGPRDGEAVDLLLSRGPDEWVAERGWLTRRAGRWRCPDPRSRPPRTRPPSPGRRRCRRRRAPRRARLRTGRRPIPSWSGPRFGVAHGLDKGT